VPFETTAVQATRVPHVGAFVALADAHCGAVIRGAGSDYATFYETDPRWPDPIRFEDPATIFSTLPHINGFDDAYQLVSTPVKKRKQNERKRKLKLMSTQGRNKRSKIRRP
jgi:hypothetical protein